jgi:hypothetical protein
LAIYLPSVRALHGESSTGVAFPEKTIHLTSFLRLAGFLIEQATARSEATFASSCESPTPITWKATQPTFASKAVGVKSLQVG